MRKFFGKIVSRSFWGQATMFFAILLTILIVGSAIAGNYAGWINSFLDIYPYIRVDDNINDTPDVMYYPSDFRQWRWHWNAETEKYEFQTRWNVEGLYSYICLSRSLPRDAEIKDGMPSSLRLRSEGTFIFRNIASLYSISRAISNGSGVDLSFSYSSRKILA